MINEEIKKLLDSEMEDDNNLGWELIKAKKIPYEDVVEYVENAKVPTHWEKKYTWDGSKFVKNPYLSELYNLSGTSSTGLIFGGSGYPTASTSIGSGSITFNTGSSYPRYWKMGSLDNDWKEEYKKQRDAEIQKEKELDKPRGIWSNIKNAFKRK